MYGFHGAVSGIARALMATERNYLRFLASEKMDLLLVCGKVAKETYQQCGYVAPHVIYMDHPAARRWNGLGMELMREKIRTTLVEIARAKEVTVE